MMLLVLLEPSSSDSDCRAPNELDLVLAVVGLGLGDIMAVRPVRLVGVAIGTLRCALLSLSVFLILSVEW